MTGKNDSCPICGARHTRETEHRLRDSAELRVRACESCTHVFLDSFAHVGAAYFRQGDFLRNKPFKETVEDRLRHYAGETNERAARIGGLVANKRVLDFGCGAGALMERLKPLAKSVEGLEPTEPFREWLRSRGLAVHREIEDLRGPYDVVLMFHVLEHLPDPVSALRALAQVVAPGGAIYLEVPNVNDALISLYAVEAARKFLFFIDHLHYFSRASLARAIGGAGLTATGIVGHNRFGLANHLHWLSRGKPDGHNVWSFLNDEALSSHYARVLAAADLSDSLIAQIQISPSRVPGSAA